VQRRAARRMWLSAVCVAVLAAGACDDGRGSGGVGSAVGSSEVSARPPVTLPDLSRADEPVQQQIRSAHDRVQRLNDSPAAPRTEVAAAYGELGRLLIAAEYLDAAAGCFLNAQSLAPDDMRWPYYLGHVYRLQHNPPDAIRYFTRALDLDPDDVPTLAWLGELYLSQSEHATAERLLERALALQPRSVAILYGLGRAALARDDHRRAVERLEEALALDPSATGVHYPLAMAYRGLGELGKADSHLQLRNDGVTVIEPADPLMQELATLLHNAAAYEVRGDQALGRQDWAEAVGHFRTAVDLDPSNPFTRLNLGTTLYLTGDTPGAIRQVETAIELSPEFPKAHFTLGVLMEAAGRDQEAIRRFTAAISYDSSYTEAHYSLADALRRNGRVEESLTHYTRVLAFEPGMSPAAFGRAMALVRLGRHREARDQLEQALRTYPGQPGFAHALARLLAAAPDPRVRDGRRALALMDDLLGSQQSIGLSETMAMTLAELGRYEEASAWQRNAIEAARSEGLSDLAARLTLNLRLYEQGRPSRTPWPDDDPVHYPRAQ
jgi:tetratricopeptide (TPR) repeat protein